jgi:hypothetical protein
MSAIMHSRSNGLIGQTFASAPSGPHAKELVDGQKALTLDHVVLPRRVQLLRYDECMHVTIGVLRPGQGHVGRNAHHDALDHALQSARRHEFRP